MATAAQLKQKIKTIDIKGKPYAFSELSRNTKTGQSKQK